MPENAAMLFEDKKRLLKKLKKPIYEANFKEFRGRYNSYFYDWMRELEASADKESTAASMAEEFVASVKEGFAPKGKISGAGQFDLNLFMVYYVFPTILMCDLGDSRLMCDKLCEEWNRGFKNCNLGYVDYDKLYNSFNDKILGLFKV